MDKFELGIALSKIYDFMWDEFCDWYIEIAKYRIYHAEEDPQGANDALWTLKEVLKKSLNCFIHICRSLQKKYTANWYRKKSH